MSTLRERIAAVIEAYSAQGIHRTGSDVDGRSGAWLAHEIRELGLVSIAEPLPFSRLEIEQAFVEVGERRFEGLPRFDSTPTGAKGVEAPLTWNSARAGCIGVAVVRPHGGEARGALQALEQNARSVGAIAVTDPEWMPSGMGLLNAPRYREPVGPPFLQLPAQCLEPLRETVDRGAPARLVIETHRTDTTAFNIGGSIPGRDASLAPVVVMTPRSGWWSCAQERGGGIAALLETMRAVAEAPRRRDVLFTANTGHELGHLGLDHFLAQRAGLERNAHCWFHFGANFAANNPQSLVLQFSRTTLKERALAVFANHGLEPDRVREPGERPAGEAGNVFDGGGEYISVLGYGHYFHHPDDVWPGTVDLEKTERVVAALCELVVRMADDAA